MAGIYIHIPFCKQQCTYCNFHFTTSLRYKEAMLQALAREIETEQHYLQGEDVQTIYFGGGTPSLLSAAEIQSLLHTVSNHYKVAADAEITLEVNPDDIHIEKLHACQSAGVNRLSMGIQSFLDEELRYMNRAHSAEDALRSLHEATKLFENISVDLIYGSPLISDEQWEANVHLAVSSGVPHLSCYALTVEEKTPLHRQIHMQQSPDVDQEKQANQFLLLMKWLSAAGYEHYEVSNFARPGFRSRHNTAYWQGQKYLGIGPSAHSYNGVARRWNVSNNQKYIQGIQQNKLYRESEQLSERDRYNEMIMISLRTSEGINMQAVQEQWPAQYDRLIGQLQPYVASGLITHHRHAYRLSDEGMLRADGIAASLFV